MIMMTTILIVEVMVAGGMMVILASDVTGDKTELTMVRTVVIIVVERLRNISQLSSSPST